MYLRSSSTSKPGRLPYNLYHVGVAVKPTKKTTTTNKQIKV
jgi:hypothetical protein